MFFQLEIDCGNDAFTNDPETEIKRILQTEIMDKRMMPAWGCTTLLHDINGNRVGVARFIDGSIEIH